MDTNSALVTVNVALPPTAPTLALIVAVPALTPLATPELATVAIAALEEFHVAVAVTSCVVASLSVTTAWKETVPLMPVVAEPGVTVRAFTVAAGTVIVALPCLPARAAEMTAVPGATPLTTPPLTVAAGALLVQVTVPVTSRVELSA